MNKKVSVFCALLLAALISLPLNAQRSVNGVKLYHSGSFPYGKKLDMDGLTNLPTGAWQEKVYLVDPVVFKDSGAKNKSGCRIYTAKISHNIFGRLYTMATNTAASNALLKIKIPYSAPVHSGMKYQFTESAPLTVLSKTKSIDSDGSNFSIYNCVFQGYMNINGIVYPKEY